MEFRVLGELEVRAAGLLVDVGHPRLRAVPASQLTGRMCGDGPPVLEAGPDHANLYRFRRLVADAAAGDDERAGERLIEQLMPGALPVRPADLG